MEVRELWEKTSVAGKEIMICAGAGIGAWFIALFAGVDKSTAIFFGLIVSGGLAAVALWVWAQENKQNGRAIGVDFGTVVIATCGAACLLGALFFSEWLTRYGFWGTLGGLTITVISAISRHPEK